MSLRLSKGFEEPVNNITIYNIKQASKNKISTLPSNKASELKKNLHDPTKTMKHYTANYRHIIYKKQ